MAGQGHPFVYFVLGCALALAEVDLISGQARVIEAHIVHETGRSLHPDIDRSQVTGAFFQGLGWMTMEELVRDKTGRCLTATPSTYKIPGFRDLPEALHIELVERPCAKASVKGSKAVGEPPLIYGEAVYFAIRDALEAACGRAVDLPCRPRPRPCSLALERTRLGTPQAVNDSATMDFSASRAIFATRSNHPLEVRMDPILRKRWTIFSTWVSARPRASTRPWKSPKSMRIGRADPDKIPELFLHLFSFSTRLDQEK